MKMPRIELAGIWLWLWGAWHAGWLFGLVWVPFFFPESTQFYFRVLYTVFLPIELVGAVLADPEDAPGPERAKTLSQWRQFIAEMGNDGSSRWLSWKALAGATGLIDAYLVGWLVWDVNPVVGLILGIGTALWLVPHFGYRSLAG